MPETTSATTRLVRPPDPSPVMDHALADQIIADKLGQLQDDPKGIFAAGCLQAFEFLEREDRAAFTLALSHLSHRVAGEVRGEVIRMRKRAPKSRTEPAQNEDADASECADFADPVAAARSIVDAFYTGETFRLLHWWQGEFWTWTGSHYERLPPADVREVLYRVGPACSKAPIKKSTVDNVQDALRAVANLSQRDVPAIPAWIVTSSEEPDPDPREVIPLANGLLRIEDRTLLPSTPRLFVPYCLPFDYSLEVTAPVEWLRFLASIWPDDLESIHCLQEWLGLLLTADTSFQRALMIIGPKRSGKGTIGRVIIRLLGAGNVASPTLTSLGQPFGLQVLIGKTAALISDARLGGRADIASISENLLRITGEDEVSVDRKFQTAYTARLLARIVVFANEVPVFRDASSALPSRFVILRTTRSFFGEEDLHLEGKLTAELPGILAWALAGLQRLRARGRFVQPKASSDALAIMEDLASPISAFLRECCVQDPAATVPVRDMYAAWCEWCREHGRDRPGTEQTFGRDIAAAAPAVRMFRPRINGQRPRHYSGLRLCASTDHPTDDGDNDELPI